VVTRRTRLVDHIFLALYFFVLLLGGVTISEEPFLLFLCVAGLARPDPFLFVVKIQSTISLVWEVARACMVWYCRTSLLDLEM
jgi:hypothetical protein